MGETSVISLWHLWLFAVWIFFHNFLTFTFFDIFGSYFVAWIVINVQFNKMTEVLLINYKDVNRLNSPIITTEWLAEWWQKWDSTSRCLQSPTPKTQRMFQDEMNVRVRGPGPPVDNAFYIWRETTLIKPQQYGPISR